MSARLKTTAIKEGCPETALVKSLYERSFPKIERIPFSYLLNCLKTGKAELFAYSDSSLNGGNSDSSLNSENSGFVGFAFVLLPGNYAYLLFCATETRLRSLGYGSAILKKLRRRYEGRTMVVDIEPLSDAAPNSEQRMRRYMFYRSNGFRDTGLEMRDESGDYRILTDGEGFDLNAFLESYDILPEIFVGTEITTSALSARTADTRCR